MNNRLQVLDATRKETSLNLKPEAKAELGQYMTPSRIAEFMASLFKLKGHSIINLLDAGAGIGSLTIAFFEHLLTKRTVKQIFWCGYEVDASLTSILHTHIDDYCTEFQKRGISITASILNEDFIKHAVKQIQSKIAPGYNFAILNPPYKKINTDSDHRRLLHTVQIETVNLYTAFLALVLELMQPGGQVVAIVPRSFCNGPYYKPFRERMLSHAAIRQIHLFSARDKAFQDEGVLQENIIMYLERDGQQGKVKISTSTDDTFADYAETTLPFRLIVKPNDSEKFIHIPTTNGVNLRSTSQAFQYDLANLGLEVSTGPVVDFRASEFLRAVPEIGTVPLLYPMHFNNWGVQWPKIGGKKPNALILNDETRRLLFQNGFYVVVHRFSSKEEQKRIVASVLDPAYLQSELIGFENHLNVFHSNKNGLPADLAFGLCFYLNSSFVDDYFRSFSGHTQVNAADLRFLRYPSRDILIQMGQWAREQTHLTQTRIDEELEHYV